MSLVKKGYLLDGVEETKNKLGGGGFASVFLGKWNGSQVAVKRLHPTLMGLDENSRPTRAFQRFMQEYPILCTLTHPSIVQVYGMVKPSSPQGSYGVVMELLPTTLKKRYGQEPALRWSQEVSVLISISSGVEYLHSKGILHRDITTSNVMLTERGAGTEWLSAKIVDVGVARALDDLTREEQTLSLEPGADRYMAPEVLDPVDDQVARYGKPADIFSVGVTTLAMCLKREPPRLAVICREGRTGDMADMDEDHPLYGTLVQCLATDSSIRPSAQQLCADLTVMQRLYTCSVAESTDCDVAVSAVTDQGEVAAVTAELQRALARACAERDRIAQQLEVAVAEKDRVSLEYVKVVEERDSIRAECDDATAERNRLSLDLSSSISAMEQISQKMESAISERDRLAQLVQNASVDQDRLTQQLRDARTNQERISSELAEVQRGHTRIDVVTPQLSKANTGKTSDNSTWKAIIKDSQEPPHTGIYGLLVENDGTLARCQRLFADGSSGSLLSQPPKVRNFTRQQ